MARTFGKREARTHPGVGRLALITAAVMAGTVLIASGAEALLTPLGRRVTGVGAAAASLLWALGLLKRLKVGR